MTWLQASTGFIASLLLLGSLSCRPSPTTETPTSGTATPTDADAPRRVVDLYFPGADGRLHAEPRDLPVTEDPEAAIHTLVAALVSGPQGDGLWPPLTSVRLPEPKNAPATETDPEEAPVEPPTHQRALAVYLVDNTVVVDLPAPDGPPAVGARQEILMLYSLVNTVVLNTPGAERLIVLWNGLQPSTFAGHIDTARALAPRPSMIAQPAVS